MSEDNKQKIAKEAIARLQLVEQKRIEDLTKKLKKATKEEKREIQRDIRLSRARMSRTSEGMRKSFANLKIKKKRPPILPSEKFLNTLELERNLLEFAEEKYGSAAVRYCKKRLDAFSNFDLNDAVARFQIHAVILEEYYILLLKDRILLGITGAASTVLDRNLSEADTRLRRMYEDLNALKRQKERPDPRGGSLKNLIDSHEEEKKKDKSKELREEELLKEKRI